MLLTPLILPDGVTVKYLDQPCGLHRADDGAVSVYGALTFRLPLVGDLLFQVPEGFGTALTDPWARDVVAYVTPDGGRIVCSLWTHQTAPGREFYFYPEERRGLKDGAEVVVFFGGQSWLGE